MSDLNRTWQVLLALLLLGVPSLAQGVRVAAAGDIACSPSSDPNYRGGRGTTKYCGQGATADLIRQADVDAVLALGDLQYSSGRLGAFRQSYEKSWGRFKDLTYAVPGNHEYVTRDAKGYFSYFGNLTGVDHQGYYSFDLGDWHIVALNSNCGDVAGGCEADSPQVKWLEQDLENHPASCTLAFWHHPRFSSGRHGSHSDMTAFWEALYAANAELVLVGHDHHYERFALQTAEGDANPERGLREFVVGTGGKSFYQVGEPQPNSEKIVTDRFGILVLDLKPASYSWQFRAVDHKEPLDRGEARCH